MSNGFQFDIQPLQLIANVRYLQESCESTITSEVQIIYNLFSKFSLNVFKYVFVQNP